MPGGGRADGYDMSAAQAARRLGRSAPAKVVGPLPGWLAAAAALGALVVVFAGGRSAADTQAVTPPPLSAHPRAAEVAGVFSGLTPFQVQESAGESRGKDATCSIFSDGNLDTGARVTWAVTLCTVHRVGAAG